MHVAVGEDRPARVEIDAVRHRPALALPLGDHHAHRAHRAREPLRLVPCRVLDRAGDAVADAKAKRRRLLPRHADEREPAGAHHQAETDLGPHAAAVIGGHRYEPVDGRVKLHDVRQ
eukprot:2086150-Prymnesium_polylepis.1